MKPINTYLNCILEEAGFRKNLGIDGEAIVKYDIERLEKIYPGVETEYDAKNSILVVKHPFAQPYLLLNITEPLPDAGVNSIVFVNRNLTPISQYTFWVRRNCDYPGRLFDKVVFPKGAEIKFNCFESLKIDDDVYKGSKFVDRTPSLTISDEEVKSVSVLDLSDFTRPLGSLQIFDFKNIEFNQKQKIKDLKLNLLAKVPHINTLPDCDTLTIDVSCLGKAELKILLSMFDDFTPNRKKPRKINFIGNIDPSDELQIKNIINNK